MKIFVIIIMSLIPFSSLAKINSIESLILSDIVYQDTLDCLALNIYHEARGDSKLGQAAVAFVTLNRVAHPSYPSTVCEVVFQSVVDSHGNPVRNMCQFSWYCDGKSDKPKEKKAFEIAKYIAEQVLRVYGVAEDFTGGAIMYHATYVNPSWSDHYDITIRIDNHIFYK